MAYRKKTRSWVTSSGRIWALSLGLGASVLVAFAAMGMAAPTGEKGASRRDGAAVGGGFSLRGALTKARATGEANQSAGGDLKLTGGVSNVGSSRPIKDDADGFVLVGERQENQAGEADCFCDAAFFTDGFESGDTSAWSATSP